eukprot:3183747-Pleurochrysis_carterae.AAC.1
MRACAHVQRHLDQTEAVDTHAALVGRFAIDSRGNARYAHEAVASELVVRGVEHSLRRRRRRTRDDNSVLTADGTGTQREYK